MRDRAKLVRDYPFGQIIVFLKAATRCHGQIARTPEIFKRRLVGVPVPPATCLARRIAPQISRTDRTVLTDLFHERGGPVQEPMSLPFLPAPAQGLGITGKAQTPMGIERHRNYSGIMGPVFEHCAVTRQQIIQLAWLVSLTPRKQDHMMRALDRGDAVKLHETQPGDQLCKASRTAPRRRPRQGVTLQHDHRLWPAQRIAIANLRLKND